MLFAALLVLNLWIADRLAPRTRLPGPEEQFIERYQQIVGRRAWLFRIGVGLLFGLVAGVPVASQWKDWLLFTHSVSFGQKDAQFGIDIGFYVFKLPFLTFLVDWLFAALVIVLIITAVAHYLNGGIRLQVQGRRVTPQVKLHLSVLLALLALLKAAGYWLQRYKLTFSTRGVVERRHLHGRQRPAARPSSSCSSSRCWPRCCSSSTCGSGAGACRSSPSGCGRFVAVVAGSRLSGLRAALPGAAGRVHQRGTLHRAQHHGDANGDGSQQRRGGALHGRFARPPGAAAQHADPRERAAPRH